MSSNAEKEQKRSLLLGAAVVAVAGLGLYWYLNKDDKQEPDYTSSAAVQDSTATDYSQQETDYGSEQKESEFDVVDSSLPDRQPKSGYAGAPDDADGANDPSAATTRLVNPPSEPAPQAPQREWGQKGVLKIKIHNANGLEGLDRSGKSDPYVSIYVNHNKTKFKTKTVKQNNNPTWNEEFSVPIDNVFTDVITLKISDKDMLSKNDLIGTTDIQAVSLLATDGLMPLQALPIVGSKGQIYVSAKYIDTPAK